MIVKGVSDTLPEDIPSIEDAPSLFHSKEYIRLHQNKSTLIIADKSGYLAGHIRDKTFVSPQNAPFGGPVFSKSDKSKLEELVSGKLRELGLEELIVKHIPEGFSKKEAFFSEHRFVPSKITTDLNYHIDINERTFLDVIHENQRSKIHNCREDGFFCTDISLKRAYQFIEEQLSKRQIPMTMTWEQLHRAHQEIPHTYEAMGVLNQQELIAAAIIVRVNDQVTYLAYNTHHKEYNKFSPLVFLYEYIYNELRERGQSIFDLGICSVNGEINQGLKEFKSRMGGVASSKKTITYSIK